MQGGKEQATLTSAFVSCQAVCFSPDGKTLAAAGSPDGEPEGGGAVELWDVGARARKTTLKGSLKAGISSLAFAKYGRVIVSARERLDERFQSPTTSGRSFLAFPSKSLSLSVKMGTGSPE